MVKRWLRVQYSSLIGWNLSPWMRTSWPSTGKPLLRKIHQSPKLKTMYRHKTQYRKLGFMMGSESFVDTNNISCGFFTSYFCFCFLKFKIYANARTPPKKLGSFVKFLPQEPCATKYKQSSGTSPMSLSLPKIAVHFQCKQICWFLVFLSWASQGI